MRDLKDVIDDNEILKNRVEILEWEKYELKKRLGKPCKVCGKRKPLDEFRKHSRYIDGLDNMCKVCRNKHTKRHS